MSAIILIIFFAGSFVGAMFILRRRIVRTAPTEPSCGKCGYCVVGLQGTICPECGSDLRDVGIVTPNQSNMPLAEFALFAATWSIVLLLVAVSASSFITDSFPYVRTLDQYRAIFCQSSYLNTTIEAHELGVVRDWGERPAATPDHLMLIINVGGMRRQQMDVDLRTKAYTYADASGHSVSKPSGFDVDVLIDWLAVGKVDPNDARVRDRANEIMFCIDELTSNSAGGFTRFDPAKRAFADPGVTAHPASRYIRTSNWVSIALLVFWAFVWMLGMWWIARRYARENLAQRRAQAVSAPALP